VVHGLAGAGLDDTRVVGGHIAVIVGLTGDTLEITSTALLDATLITHIGGELTNRAIGSWNIWTHVEAQVLALRSDHLSTALLFFTRRGSQGGRLNRERTGRVGIHVVARILIRLGVFVEEVDGHGAHDLRTILKHTVLLS